MMSAFYRFQPILNRLTIVQNYTDIRLVFLEILTPPPPLEKTAQKNPSLFKVKCSIFY